MTVALVRRPGASFPAALSEHPDSATIDLAEALRQHAAYVEALRGLGVDVIELPPEHDLPDACFVEDCAVFGGRDALLCRLGAPSRAAEPDTLAGVLAGHVERLERMPEGACLDGGDVLRFGSTYFVGRSARTNEAGIAALSSFAAERGAAVVPVGVPAGFLHLESAVTRFADDGLVGVPAALAAVAFRDVPRLLAAAAGEEPAANVLFVAGSVVMAAGCPGTAGLLRAKGCAVVEVPLGEFTKADGGPTCLSLYIG